MLRFSFAFLNLLSLSSAGRQAVIAGGASGAGAVRSSARGVDHVGGRVLLSRHAGQLLGEPLAGGGGGGRDGQRRVGGGG